jgi:hypothetical protein
MHLVFVHLACELVHLVLQLPRDNIIQPGNILTTVHDVQKVSKAFIKKGYRWNVGIRCWTIIEGRFLLRNLVDIWIRRRYNFNAFEAIINALWFRRRAFNGYERIVEEGGSIGSDQQKER